MRYLLANDLAELVHIFKENVVVRHSPNPSGLERERCKKKKKIPKIYVVPELMVLSRKGGGGGGGEGNEGHERHTFRQKKTDRLQLVAAGMAVKEFQWKVLKKKKSSCCLLGRPPHPPLLPSFSKRAAQLRLNRLNNPVWESTGPAPPSFPFCFPVSSSRVKKAAHHTRSSVNTRAKTTTPRLGVCSRSRAQFWD